MLHGTRLVSFALLAVLSLRAEATVVLYLDNALPETSTENEMKAEFATVTHSLVGPVEWRPLATRTGLGEDAHLIVVRFRGDCSTTAQARPVISGEPLASVQEVNGRILPYVLVYCDALVSTVATAFEKQTPTSRSTLLGRALGRVLAHEVHHILEQSHAHQKRGVYEASLNQRDLTQPEISTGHSESSFGGESSGR